MTQDLNPDHVRDFVLAGHGNVVKVKEMLAAEPRLLTARYPEFNETALEAASHMGNRPIAEYLLAQGETMTICTAAMLGLVDEVTQFLETDSTLANAKGAHGIPLIFHAALSGDTVVTDTILVHGGGTGLEQSIHAAIKPNHVTMTKWLLDHGAATDVKNFQDQTPLEVAIEQGHDEIVQLLRDHQADY